MKQLFKTKKQKQYDFKLMVYKHMVENDEFHGLTDLKSLKVIIDILPKIKYRSEIFIQPTPSAIIISFYKD